LDIRCRPGTVKFRKVGAEKVNEEWDEEAEEAPPTL
jgi:hypothetical protein